MYICLLPCIFFGNRDAFVFSTFCHSVFKKIIVGDRKMFWNLFLGKEVKLNNKQKKKRKRIKKKGRKQLRKNAWVKKDKVYV